MEPNIIITREIKLIGMRSKTSLNNSNTVNLWSQFMGRKKEIRNNENKWHYSVQVYDAKLKMENFTPDTVFETYAAVEVKNFKEIPHGMEAFKIEGGTYAVFIHKGATDTFHKTADFIFNMWLPNSKYELDNRMHFEI